MTLEDILNTYAQLTEHYVKGPGLIAVHPRTLRSLQNRFNLILGTGGGYYMPNSTFGFHGPSFVSDHFVPAGEAHQWETVAAYRKHCEERERWLNRHGNWGF